MQYDINLPGIQDFIRIPALESKKLKQQRAIRLATSKSPVPESLQWIPTVINALDNAQDLLYTTLTIAKPLLRRLPARFIPWLGWVLLANDLLNVSNAALAVALGGRSWKRTFLEVSEVFFGRRARRLLRVHQFLQHTPMFPFIIQAGQSLQWLTGYGISLGAAMGAVTDAVWGALRVAQGQKVVIHGPPPDDILSKAARYMLHMPSALSHIEVLSQTDRELLLGANSVALQILQDQVHPDLVGARHDELLDMQVPGAYPWNKETREAVGLDPEQEEPDSSYEAGSGIPSENPHPTYREVFEKLPTLYSVYEETMANTLRNTEHASVLNYVNNAALLDNWRWQAQDEKAIDPVFEAIELDTASAIEFNVFPINANRGEDYSDWITTAGRMGREQGYGRADFESLKTAATAILGGFERKRFETVRSEPTVYPWNKLKALPFHVTLGRNGPSMSQQPSLSLALYEQARLSEIYPNDEIWIHDLLRDEWLPPQQT